MKKMFCLMLVAVLMVGVMPFQAFADGFTVTIQANGTTVATQTLSGSIALADFFPAGYETADCTGINASNDDPWSAVLSLTDTTNITNHTVLNYIITVCPCGISMSNTTATHTNNTCPKYVHCDGSITCPATVSHYENCGIYCNELATCPNPLTGAHHSTCLSLLVCSYCEKRGHEADTCPDLYCACGAKKADKLHPASCTLIFDCCGGNEAAGTHAADCPTYQACCGAAKPGHTDACSQFYACCGAAKTGSHAATCTQFYSCCGAAKTGNHATGCTTQKCPEPGCNSYNGHPGLHNIPCTVPGCTKLKNHDGEHTVACTTANCALNLGHAGDHKCACGLYLQKSTQHSTGCPYYENPANNAVLYVWAKLYTGDVKTSTVLLDTITGLSSNDLVYQVVSNNEGRIRSKIPAGYGWTGHVYYEQDPKTVLDVQSKLTVGAEDDVVLNLYSDQKLVVARVHTGKTYAIDRNVNIDGFKVGDTVSSNDVLKAVQKYYNVSTMKMYTPTEWEKVVSGKTGAVIPNYEVHAGDNIIDVYVTGSHKTTSGTTNKADSTNPKTGDEIFVPMTVLFASVSSLAVLLYLNKKRAF